MLGLGLTTTRGMSRGRAPAWTPARLFADGQQGVWYEPKPEYLFQDAAGTIAVTADGDPVGYMQDLSGNGNHATQSTSAERPVFPGLQYDGVDDNLFINDGRSPGDFTWMTAVSTDEMTAGDHVIFGTGAAGSLIILYANTSLGSASNQTRAFLDGAAITGPDVRQTGVRVFTLKRQGDVYTLYVDDVPEATHTTAIPHNGDFYLGRSPGGSYHVRTDKFGPVIVTNEALSDGERQNATSYLLKAVS